MKKHILIYILFILASCTNNLPTNVEKALVQARANRTELEKVITHYQNQEDRLKLKAAYFLIANMPGKYYYSGEILDEYNEVFNIMDTARLGKDDPWISANITPRFDSLQRIYGPLNPATLNKKYDIETLTAEYIINNIDMAFVAWQYPWAQHYSFEQFCDYILPYKVLNEKPENWRSKVMKKLSWIDDSVSDKTDIMEVAALINKHSLGHHEVFNKYVVDMSFGNMQKGEKGICSHQNAYKIYLMRGMGVPVAADRFMFAGSDAVHDCSSILKPDGKFADFYEAFNDELAMRKYVDLGRIAKVYRRLYEFVDNKRTDIIPMLHEFQTDVTKQHLPVSNIYFNIGNIANDIEYAFICTFADHKWRPVDFCKIENNNVEFTDMGRNTIYMPAVFKNGALKPLNMPVRLTKDGTLHPLIPDTEKTQTITLYRKKPLITIKKERLRRLIEGVFQGANNADFSDAVVLYEITSIPKPYTQEIEINNTKSFRYIRFLFSDSDKALGLNQNWTRFSLFRHNLNALKKNGLSDTIIKTLEKHINNVYATKTEFVQFLEKTFDNKLTPVQKMLIIKSTKEHNACMAELEFYGKNDIQLSGNPIAGYNQHNIAQNAYDNNILTFYMDSRRGKVTKYIGIDLGEGNKRQITKIKYCPRNDDNNIRIGDTYELFYWDNRWKTLSIKTAKEHYLTFENVPTNSLLWLRNYTRGVEEDVFTFDNGRQVWW